MGDFDVLVRGGLVVGPDRSRARTSASRTGSSPRSAPSSRAARRRRSTRPACTLLPGCVDAHVHLNDPGTRLGRVRHRHGGARGRRAARASSTCRSTRARRRSTAPRSTSRSRRRRAGRTSTSRSGAGSCPGDVDRLDELAERGVVGFKAFMCDTGIDDFAGRRRPDAATRAWPARRALGLPVAVHAESDAITRGLAARARRRGATCDARLPRLAAGRRRARGDRARDRPRRGDRLRAARRPRLAPAAASRSSPRPAPAAST